mmetsp:Transcript_75341/g.124257  ORF Transcript_75341/g.124257 Transcript_75341/m.124257 type:complete len:241 (+) Transcript_75341:477-1199(+)
MNIWIKSIAETVGGPETGVGLGPILIFVLGAIGPSIQFASPMCSLLNGLAVVLALVIEAGAHTLLIGLRYDLIVTFRPEDGMIGMRQLVYNHRLENTVVLGIVSGPVTLNAVNFVWIVSFSFQPASTKVGDHPMPLAFFVLEMAFFVEPETRLLLQFLQALGWIDAIELSQVQDQTIAQPRVLLFHTLLEPNSPTFDHVFVVGVSQTFHDGIIFSLLNGLLLVGDFNRVIFNGVVRFPLR